MMTTKPKQRVTKSVVTCDLEGRIETFNKGAVEIFGYTPDEVINKKRVSLFSPGLIVLGHVNNWLNTAVAEGEYKGETVFVRKDGTRFPARVRITPTYRNGEHIGYCGVTEPLPDADPASVMPKISLWTRAFAGLVVLRAPFLSATIIPIVIAAAWVASRLDGAAFNWLGFALALMGGVALQVAANTFNDYYDWKSGTDPENNNYFLPYTGGSRSLELRLITERGLFRIAIIASLVAVGIGALLLAWRGWPVAAFGIIGLLSAYFYTAPPLRLVARRGLGELLVGLNFGPLMVAGTAFVLTGELTALDFVVGLPIGLLTAAILWINEFPDMQSDIATGKVHLVATLGKQNARYGYVALAGLSYALVIYGVIAGWLTAGGLLALATLPLAAYATLVLLRHYEDRSLIRANLATIVLHSTFGIMLALGLLL